MFHSFPISQVVNGTSLDIKSVTPPKGCKLKPQCVSAKIPSKCELQWQSMTIDAYCKNTWNAPFPQVFLVSKPAGRGLP